ncbi:phage morphogenesis protein [Salmonella enterica subsp. enterica serovar Kotte]|nr:phage morphogenesis protein [Salmonella enterica subsp. enterica serovar Kotte]
MGASLTVSGTEQFRQIADVINKLASKELKTELLHSLGAVVESQTRRRIISEKTAPSGEAWPAWSDSYAGTRHSGQSLLRGNGDLLDSIQFVVERGRVRVGSSLSYAGVHQDGFSGKVRVGAHQRLVTQAFGRALRYPVWQSVGAFSRQVEIPQREYLGVSATNREELMRVITDFWSEVLA